VSLLPQSESHVDGGVEAGDDDQGEDKVEEGGDQGVVGAQKGVFAENAQIQFAKVP
jgi:hypothetical protein